MAKLMRFKKTDGSEVRILMEDKGDVIPGDAKHRDDRPFPAYTSQFKIIGGEQWYVQVDKKLADASGNVNLFRLMEDQASLVARNIIPETMEVLTE